MDAETQGGGDGFGKEELEAGMRTRWLGRKIFWHERIDSTITETKRMAEKGAEEGILVTAQEQTAGRGRRGRAWVSPPGVNLYFSVLLRPDIAPDKASMLTLVIALDVCRAIRELYGGEPQIKWPNDVVINGKKVTGILTEMCVEKERIRYVVPGIGVNVRAQRFPEELKNKAGTLEEELGCPVSRRELLGRILEHFEKDYGLFLETCDLSGLIKEYNACLVNRDRKVRVLDPAGEYSGIARGINACGELLVEREDGCMERVYAGEVSVRGVLGYV